VRNRQADIVLAGWGASVAGFDFNPISIERARKLAGRFTFGDRLAFSVGDVDTFPIDPATFDIAVSFGVVAHVPDQRRMFQRMADAARRGGFVVLGYVEDSGLIQRLLHRAIVRANSDRSDVEIFAIAEHCFAEHIDRSVRIGGRTAAAVINDYLVNPHYIGLSSHALAEWGDACGLEFYSTWPNTDLPFVVDSPYFSPLSRTSPVYRLFVTLNRLRWVFAQQEDETVFGEIAEAVSGLDRSIEAFLERLTDTLQSEQYTDAALTTYRQQRRATTDAAREAGVKVVEHAAEQLEKLGEEIDRLLTLIVRKVQDGAEFDLAQVRGLLFHGYNGLGTSYTVFHKPE
jgi:SAM-dependent methyltransferase